LNRERTSFRLRRKGRKEDQSFPRGKAHCGCPLRAEARPSPRSGKWGGAPPFYSPAWGKKRKGEEQANRFPIQEKGEITPPITIQRREGKRKGDAVHKRGGVEFFFRRKGEHHLPAHSLSWIIKKKAAVSFQSGKGRKKKKRLSNPTLKRRPRKISPIRKKKEGKEGILLSSTQVAFGGGKTGRWFFTLFNMRGRGEEEGKFGQLYPLVFDVIKSRGRKNVKRSIYTSEGEKGKNPVSASLHQKKVEPP